MKLLHTSDWHLGKRLERFSRIEEQKDVLREICEIADKERVDAVLIAGDLFDTFNPPCEAIDLLYKTLKKLSNNGKRPVVAIAGNHDSPERIEAPDPLARECGIIFLGYPNTKILPFILESGFSILKTDQGFIEISLLNKNPPLRILCTPYANENRLKLFLGSENSEEKIRELLQEHWQKLSDKYCDEKGINILLTHLFFMEKDGEKPDEPDDERPILHIGGTQEIYSENTPHQIQYVATGHLHSKQIINFDKGVIAYCGSPLSFSMNESNHNKFVLIIDIEPGEKAVIQEIQLTKGKKLLRKRFDNIDTAVAWLTENPKILVELTMVTDTFLTAEDRKRLTSSHDGIVAIIPEVKDASTINDVQKTIDLTKSTQDLFIDYFKTQFNQQEPNNDLLSLFTEVLSVEQES